MASTEHEHLEASIQELTERLAAAEHTREGKEREAAAMHATMEERLRGLESQRSQEVTAAC